VCCWSYDVLEDAFLLVVEVFDGRDPLLAAPPQRGSPYVPFEGAARVRVVGLERAAAGADGFYREAGGLGFEALEVRLKAPVARPVCDEFMQGTPRQVELCRVIVELLQLLVAAEGARRLVPLLC